MVSIFRSLELHVAFKKENLRAIDEMVEIALLTNTELVEFPLIRSLTDRDLIDRWLLLALPRPLNEITSEELARAMVYCGYRGQQIKHVSYKSTENLLIKLWQENGQPARAVNWWKSIETDRLDFRRRLDRFMRAPRAALREMRDDLDEFRKELLVVPKYRRDGDQLVLDLHYFPTSPRAGYGHVLDLLMDSKRCHGKDLRTCSLADCKAFFLSTPRGRGGPRSKFCSDACKWIDVRQRAAERQQRWREKKRNATRSK